MIELFNSGSGLGIQVVIGWAEQCHTQRLIRDTLCQTQLYDLLTENEDNRESKKKKTTSKMDTSW